MSNINYSSVQLGEKTLEKPLIQGGMGVGVSLGGLAGAVAAEGAMGCISTADIGFQEPDFAKHPQESNLRALKKEIEKARQIAAKSLHKGLIAINTMVVTRHYGETIRAAVEAGIDAVISGAGLPMELPEFVPEGKALIAPIVSSGRAAALIVKMWVRKYNRIPDFVVMEGHKAGGHLGFKRDDLLSNRCKENTALVQEVKEALAPFEAQFQRKIPVFAAGGIWDHQDFLAMQEAGADGVQVATRMIGTYECDAAQGFKDVLLKAGQEDLRIIQSPVGMPGRAVYTPLLKRMEENGRIAPNHCYGCISVCNPAETKYCITHALTEAVRGNYEEGLFFSGANAGRLTKMQHVHDVICDILGD